MITMLFMVALIIIINTGFPEFGEFFIFDPFSVLITVPVYNPMPDAIDQASLIGYNVQKLWVDYFTYRTTFQGELEYYYGYLYVYKQTQYSSWFTFQNITTFKQILESFVDFSDPVEAEIYKELIIITDLPNHNLITHIRPVEINTLIMTEMNRPILFKT